MTDKQVETKIAEMQARINRMEQNPDNFKNPNGGVLNRVKRDLITLKRQYNIE